MKYLLCAAFQKIAAVLLLSCKNGKTYATMTDVESRSKNLYIAVSGVMGTGKTTASRLLADAFGYHLLKENVSGNVFLPLFYKNPKRWALPAQLFYLQEKIEQSRKIGSTLGRIGLIQDSPVYQDYLTYAKAQFLLGNMSREEFDFYEQIFHSHTKDFLHPNLIVQLNASLPTIQKRIRGRGNEYEKSVSQNYLMLISNLQRKWLDEMPGLKILDIDTNMLDLVANNDHKKIFINLVTDWIGRLK